MTAGSGENDRAATSRNIESHELSLFEVASRSKPPDLRPRRFYIEFHKHSVGQGWICDPLVASAAVNNLFIFTPALYPVYYRSSNWADWSHHLLCTVEGYPIYSGLFSNVVKRD